MKRKDLRERRKKAGRQEQSRRARHPNGSAFDSDAPVETPPVAGQGGSIGWLARIFSGGGNQKNTVSEERVELAAAKA